MILPVPMKPQSLPVPTCYEHGTPFSSYGPGKPVGYMVNRSIGEQVNTIPKAVVFVFLATFFEL
jgi:hypothetical protein